MRVIAGKYKGRVLKAPDGRNTRPTTDRIKESLFSSIISHSGDLEGTYVLDAFAGSGALGLECLSRGAASATFFELDKQALKALRANIAMLALPEQAAHVRCADVLTNPPAYGKAFDIVLLDPPYALPPSSVVSLLDELYAANMLQSDVLIAYEHALDAPVEAALAQAEAPLHVVSEKKYGKTTAVSLLALE